MQKRVLTSDGKVDGAADSLALGVSGAALIPAGRETRQVSDHQAMAIDTGDVTNTSDSAGHHRLALKRQMTYRYNSSP